MSDGGISTFTGEEFRYIEKLLRQVYTIRTVNGEEDELLGDFIAALADGDTISLED